MNVGWFLVSVYIIDSMMGYTLPEFDGSRTPCEWLAARQYFSQNNRFVVSQLFRVRLASVVWTANQCLTRKSTHVKVQHGLRVANSGFR